MRQSCSKTDICQMDSLLRPFSSVPRRFWSVLVAWRFNCMRIRLHRDETRKSTFGLSCSGNVVTLKASLLFLQPLVPVLFTVSIRTAVESGQTDKILGRWVLLIRTGDKLSTGIGSRCSGGLWQASCPPKHQVRNPKMFCIRKTKQCRHYYTYCNNELLPPMIPVVVTFFPSFPIPTSTVTHESVNANTATTLAKLWLKKWRRDERLYIQM